MKSARCYSALLDLVGTRELARQDPAAYYGALESFRGSIVMALKQVEPARIRAFMFSDSLFCEVDDAVALCDFLQELRQELMRSAIYFSGAAAPIPLEARLASELPGLLHSTKKDLQESLQGYYFGKSAAYLYARQQALKGIGIFLAPEADGKRPKWVKTRVEPSLCIPDVGARRARQFYDLGFRRDDLTSENFSTLLSSLFYAKTRSKRYGRYYLSPMVLWARSEDYAGATTDAQTPMLSALLSGQLDRMLGKWIGLEFVYIAMLGKLLGSSRSIDPALLYDARKKILSHQKVVDSLEDASPSLLEPDMKRECFEYLAKQHYSKRNP